MAGDRCDQRCQGIDLELTLVIARHPNSPSL
jgi:hypothetical protein